MYQDFFDKNDEYLNDFKQKVANQKIATVEERRSELARSRNNFLSVFAGITLAGKHTQKVVEERRSELARSRNNFLSVFAGITLAGLVGWFVLSPQYAQESTEIPVIRRPQTAIKIRPENPGGMEIPNQDKDVYNIVEKKNVDNTVVENLLPTPETPKLPDIVPEVSDIDENAADLDEIVDEVVDLDENTEKATEETKETVQKTVENTQEKIIETAEKTQQSAKESVAAVVPEKPVDLLKKEEPKPVEKVQEKAQKIVEEKKEEKIQAPVQQANGKWQIQLLASKNKDSVEKAWNDLSNRYSVLKSYTHEIQTSDLGAQGIFYRLRAGLFADKAAADAACAALKKQGLNDCIVKER